MDNRYEHMDILIAKALAGEASVEERAMLDAWRSQSPENQDHVTETERLFTAIEEANVQLPVDVNAAWNKLEQRISPRTATVIPVYRRRTVLRAAASLALIVSLALLINWLYAGDKVRPVILAAAKAPVEQKLPDGSKVVINKNSEIAYVLNDNNEREVRLKGEAFFEVVHDDKQPFVITDGEIIIKDIGTAFNVKAVPGSGLVEVFVESGEVQFYSAADKGIYLAAGERAVYNRASKVFSRSIPETASNAGSYHSRIFHFAGAPLKEVIDQVNQVYGSDIRLENSSLAGCRLSVVFNNEKIDVLVSIIAETLDLRVEKRGETILLKGESCSQ